MKYKLNIRSIVWLGSILIFSISYGTTYANTVTNVVSVEAESDGTGGGATVRVKSIVNGEVVEDYTETNSTGNIYYESTLTNSDIIVKTSTSSSLGSSSNASQLSLLQQLLKKLLEILTGNKN